MRYRADRSLRILSGTDGRPVAIGGSPLRLWRLTPAGGALVEQIIDGADIDPIDGSAAAALVERLVDGGALHPAPAERAASSTDGGFTPADVTVIVPVRDRPSALDGLLGSLAPVRSAGAAVVVVDDGSVDDAAHRHVAEVHGATYLRRDVAGGPAVARDDGIAALSTRVVVFLDSDCTVATEDGAGWLDPLLAQLGDQRVAAVAPRVTTPDGPSVLDRYESTRSPLDMGDEPARVRPGTRVSFVPSAALAVRVDAYRSIGGFDRTLRVGEDVDLVWRLVDGGWTVRYEPTSVVQHPARPTAVGWLRQRFDYGSSAAGLAARHGDEVAPLRSPWWVAVGWAAVGARHRVIGGSILAASAVSMARRLDGVPLVEAMRISVDVHGRAGDHAARAVLRTWWPAILPAAVVVRPARRVLTASVLTVAAGAVRDALRRDAETGDRSGIGELARIGALAVADDATYAVGVWAGCVRARSARALLPKLTRA